MKHVRRAALESRYDEKARLHIMKTMVSCLLISAVVFPPAFSQDKTDADLILAEPKITVVGIAPTILSTKPNVDALRCTLAVTNKDAFADVFFEKTISSTTGKSLLSRLYCSVVDANSGKKVLPSVRLSSRTSLDSIVFAGEKEGFPTLVYLEIRDLKTKKSVRSADLAIAAPTLPEAVTPITPVELNLKALLKELRKAGISESPGLTEYLEMKPSDKDDTKPIDIMTLVDTLKPSPPSPVSLDRQKVAINKQKVVLTDVKTHLEGWFARHDLNNNSFLAEEELARAFRGAMAKPYVLEELTRRARRGDRTEFSTSGELMLILNPPEKALGQYRDYHFLSSWDKNRDRHISRPEYSQFVHSTGAHVKANLDLQEKIADLDKKLLSSSMSSVLRKKYVDQRGVHEAAIKSIRSQYQWLGHLQEMEAGNKNYGWLGLIRTPKK